MSTEDAPTGQSWPALDDNERRVLGVLVEKAKTTPDAYPMSLNALLTGCNQKSNRDPVMELEDWEVEDALKSCKDKGLVVKVVGGRVERFKHTLYESWRVDKVELAILAELLLRGPQTEGELRGRASRMEPIDDLEALRAALRPLVERGLVVYLTPPGSRGATLTHGFYPPGEMGRLKSRAASAAAAAPAAPAPAPAPPAPRAEPRPEAPPAGLATMQQELAAANGRIEALEKAVAELRAELIQLRQSLGG
jgi:uncharacterized protein YceH (UPF0502 family)